ncbi:MAG: restriction endonuclease subunit S [Desulfocapsaceae bacterium]|nr:restriction endonuclease subunit S [Desulfocapsaceae bacterium]
MSVKEIELPETLPRWDIPSNWEWVSLSDVGQLITGNTPPTKELDNYGHEIPFVKPPELIDRTIYFAAHGLSTKGMKAARVLPEGAVLVSCIGGLGKTGLAKKTIAFNQQINAIVFNEGVIPEFGFYYAQTLKPWLYSVSSATTLPIVNKGKFQRAPFPLAPLEQQKRIVAEIEKQFSRLDEAVANLRRVKANLKRYKAAVLKAAVEGRLVETEAERARREGRDYETGAQLLQRIFESRRKQWKGNGKYKEPVETDTTGLPVLPEGWVWARLDTIAALKGGITVDRKRKDSTARLVPYLRVANVQRGYLDLTEVKLIDAPASVIEALLLQLGDILFNEGGDRDKLGRGWVWESQLPECIHQNHVFRGRLFLNDVSPKLLSWWGNSFGKEYFLREGKQTTNLASINLTKLSAFPVPLSPNEEQKRIVTEVDRRFSIFREVEAQVDDNLKRAERLRQSILSKAFTGQLIEPIALGEE